MPIMDNMNVAARTRLIISFALNVSFVHAERTNEIYLIYIVLHCAQVRSRLKNEVNMHMWLKERGIHAYVAVSCGSIPRSRLKNEVKSDFRTLTLKVAEHSSSFKSLCLILDNF